MPTQFGAGGSPDSLSRAMVPGELCREKVYKGRELCFGERFIDLAYGVGGSVPRKVFRMRGASCTRTTQWRGTLFEKCTLEKDITCNGTLQRPTANRSAVPSHSAGVCASWINVQVIFRGPHEDFHLGQETARM